MDIKLEFGVLLILQLLARNLFGHFEIETPAIRKIIKWLMMDAVTIGLYYFIGHWSLVFPVFVITVGTTYHTFGVRKMELIQ